MSSTFSKEPYDLSKEPCITVIIEIISVYPKNVSLSRKCTLYSLMRALYSVKRAVYHRDYSMHSVQKNKNAVCPKKSVCPENATVPKMRYIFKPFEGTYILAREHYIVSKEPCITVIIKTISGFRV